MELAVAEGLATSKAYQAGRRWRLTAEGRRRVAEVRAARRDRTAKGTAAGFDMDKPLGEWTREETLAYVAWCDENDS